MDSGRKTTRRQFVKSSAATASGGTLGLHASFTVSDETLDEAALEFKRVLDSLGRPTNDAEHDREVLRVEGPDQRRGQFALAEVAAQAQHQAGRRRRHPRADRRPSHPPAGRCPGRR